MRGLPARRPRRAPRPDLAVGPGERLLAWAATDDGAVGGTRDALYLPAAGPTPHRVPWEQVEGADWDQDTSVLRIREVGMWGEVRPEHRVVVEDADRLLQLLRERVTSSVVLVRRTMLPGRDAGFRVVARRAPGRTAGPADLGWVFEFDEGVDPADATVRRLADDALRAARAEVGLA